MDKCDVKFTPPVCVQRYIAMKNMVRKLQPKKVLDMGCGECSLLKQLKQEQCLEQLTGVDIDGDLLKTHKHLAKPLMWEFLHPRPHPFTVSLYEGSISEKDQRMMGYDLVLCVEIIEHLYSDTLAAVPEVLFGYMQPMTIVFTTPNADFNVLFPDFQGFRHPDHKFEWSREEFQSWSNKVASDYGYTVTYEGIGAGPPGTEHLGCCTQMAVFTCMSPPQEGSRQVDCSPHTPYNLICEVIYPHREITMTTEVQILNEAMFYLRRCWHTARQGYCEREEGTDHVTRSGDGNTTEEQEGGTGHVTWSGDAGTTKGVVGAEEQENGANHVTLSGDAGRTENIEWVQGAEELQRETLSVSLETLFKYSSLRRVCPSVEKLREVLASCESVSFSDDGNSVLYSMEDSEDDSDNQSEESIIIDAECQDNGRLDSKEDDALSWQQEEESWDW